MVVDVGSTRRARRCRPACPSAANLGQAGRHRSTSVPGASDLCRPVQGQVILFPPAEFRWRSIQPGPGLFYSMSLEDAELAKLQGSLPADR